MILFFTQKTMKETFEKKEDWSLVITQTEEIVIQDPLQQFIFLQSQFTWKKEKLKELRKEVKKDEEDLIVHAKAAWIFIGNVTEDGKKKRLHKLDLDSDIDFDSERGDQIFLFEEDAKVAWFKIKAKKEKSEDSVE